jgi:hypothetical protein
MLKIERHRGVVAVSAGDHKKKSFLFLAFAYAFAIHAAGIILFHVSPLNILGTGTDTIPPATVTSEWQEEIISSIQENTRELPIKPPPRRPVFEKKLPDVLAKRMLALPWDQWFQNEITAYLDQTFLKELTTQATGIDVFVSGDLSQRSFEWKSPPKEIPEGLESYPAVAQFAVDVHETTGEIFRKRFIGGDKKLERIAGAWVDQVVFEPQAHRFSTGGEISMIVGPP